MLLCHNARHMVQYTLRESVQMLIDAGADVNAMTNEGETALQRAENIKEAKLGDVDEIIEILKKSGAQ